ncbi:MAG: DUF6350 family protein [Actinomycetota bacterium]|nr:DUF6350 family protein [Actinomycetota bacterium]
MTDLLTRPTTTATTPQPPVARPLTVSAVIAGVGSAGATLLTCMAVAVAGWFIADAGAHGQTNGALRTGAYIWLLGHGARLDLNGVPIGIVPLGLTAVFALAAYRSGRWAGTTSQPVTDDKSWAIGATVSTGIYVIIAVLTCVLAGQGPATASLGRALVGSLLVGGLAGSAGMAVGAGRFGVWMGRIPGWVRAVAGGAMAAVLALFAVSAGLVAVSLALSWNDAATVLSALHLHTGDALMYTLVALVVTPNAALLGTSYILGPGFVVGAGTLVSPSAVALGPMPAFPLLAALPNAGQQPWWFQLVLALPVLAGAVGGGLAQRHYAVTAWDSAALRGFGVGLAAALVTTALVALAGGPMGTGELTHVGAPLGQVFVIAVGAMSIGGLLGGLAVTWWQRRH